MIDLLAVHEKLEPINPASTALVLLDLQKVCIEQWVPEENRITLLKNVSNLLAWARKIQLSVIHVKVAFREGYPEISSSNKLFSELAASDLFLPSSPGCDFHEAVKPNCGEPTVEKHRVGAFTGTDLDMILRSRGIRTIIFGGITTTGALLSAVRQAFDLDYKLIVPGDCCVDPDNELHEIVLNRIVAVHATVTTANRLTADSIT